MAFSPELVDLLELVARLKEREPGVDRIAGYLEGKTCLRDALVSDLDCSELEAEQVVDTLVARGFVRFCDASGAAASPGESAGYWELMAEPSAS